MATTVPAGDPALSQDAAPAALAWQGRTARMPQFVGESDADAASGSLANPGATDTPPPAQSTTQLGQIDGGTPPSTSTAPAAPAQSGQGSSWSNMPADAQAALARAKYDATDPGRFTRDYGYGDGVAPPGGIPQTPAPSSQGTQTQSPRPRFQHFLNAGSDGNGNSGSGASGGMSPAGASTGDYPQGENADHSWGSPDNNY